MTNQLDQSLWDQGLEFPGDFNGQPRLRSKTGTFSSELLTPSELDGQADSDSGPPPPRAVLGSVWEAEEAAPKVKKVWSLSRPALDSKPGIYQDFTASLSPGQYKAPWKLCLWGCGGEQNFPGKHKHACL